jgi:hypothetical protein
LLSNQARAEVDVPLSAAQIEMADLAQAEVRREWQHIDILVVVPAPYEWLFIIENKVHARESEGQLKRYREVAEQAFDGWTIVPIFLTLDGHDPSEEGQEQGYIPFGHQDVADLLADLVDLNGNLPSGVQLLLDHYLQTIRRLTMSDPEITRLCQEIYKRHRRAIELILEHGTVVEASGAASRVLSSQWTQEHLPIMNISIQDRSAWFMPAAWEPGLKAVGGPGWSRVRPQAMACWFWMPANEDRVGFVIEVGPTDDLDRRLRLLDALSNHGFSIRARARTPEARYTRLYAGYQPLLSRSDEEDVLLSLLQQAMGPIDRVTAALAEFLSGE